MLTRLLCLIIIVLMAASAAAQDVPPVTEFEIGQPITAISTYSDQTVVLDAGGTIHWFSGEALTPFPLSAGGARDVAIRNEYEVATAGDTLGIYALREGIQELIENLHSLQLEYLYTGEQVVLAADHSVRVYHLDGNVMPVNFTIAPERMAVARGTGLIAVSGVNGGETVIEVGSADDGSLLQIIALNESPTITTFAIPSGGKVIAVGEDTGGIELYEIETGEMIGTLTREGIVQQIAFSNNGVLLAVAMGSEIVVWDWQNQVALWSEPIDDGTITALEFSGSDQGFWTGGSNGVVRLWSSGLDYTGSDDMLAVGGTAVVYTLGGETLRVRTGAGTDFDVLLEIDAGTSVSLIDGPVDANGFTWWQVELPTGEIGWTVESIPTIQTLRPSAGIEGPYFSLVSATPQTNSQTQGGTESNLAIGDLATVNTLNGETLNMRAGAGTSYDVVMELENTWLVHILGGPVEVDGFIWWEVELQDGTRGWVVERIEELQTLLPAAD